MECSEVRLQLDGYLKGELDKPQEMAVAYHLEKCERCAAELNSLRELNEILAVELPVFAVEGFTTSVMDAINKDRLKEKIFSFPGFSIANLGVSLVLAGLLTIFINIPYINGMVDTWSDKVHYSAVTINTSIGSTKEQIGQYLKNIFIPGGK